MSKIIFELVLQDVNAQQAISKFRKEISDANKEIQKGVGADRFKELTEKITAAKIETLKLTDEQKKLRKEFAATKVPTDSLSGLRIAYAQVTEQVTKLSRAERESDFGRNLIKRGAGLKSQIDGIEQSLGRFTGNVGNYKSALLGIGDIITGGLATGGIVVGVQKVVEVMSLGINQALKYEKALDNLSAITGLEGSDLDRLDNIARGLQEIGVQGGRIVNTGPEILESLKLVGSARPELLKDAEALGEVTKAAIILSKASGDDLVVSVKAITETMAQFGLKAKDVPDIINLLAAGAKEGKIEVPQLTDQIERLGPTAKNSNVNLAETIALFEGLAENGLKGERASVQLRNVLVKLSSAEVLPKSAQRVFKEFGIDAKILADNTIPIQDRLRELNPIIGNTSALVRIFGVENVDAASILASTIPRYEQLKGAVEGTGEAYRQAGINSDNAATKFENFQKGALNKLEETFSSASSSGGFLIDTLDFLIQKLDIFEIIVSAAIGPLSQLGDAFNSAKKLFGVDGASGKDEFQKASDDVSRLTKEVNELKVELSKAPGNEVLKATQKLTEAEKKLADAQERRIKFGAIRDSLSGRGGRKSQQLDEEFSFKDSFFPEFSDSFSAEKTNDIVDNANKVNDAVGNGIGSTKTKTEVDLVAGSIAYFRDQIADLQKELDNTPPESPLFKKLAKQIVDAEEGLARVQELLKSVLDPKDIETDVLPSAGGITVPISLEIQNEDETAKKLEDFARRTTKKAAEIKDEEDEKAAEKKQKDDEDFEKAVKEAAFGTAKAISDGIFEIQRSRQEKQKNDALSALDEETAKRIEQAQGNAVLIEKIEKEADEKRAEIEKKAALRAKNLALKQAAIDTALSIIKALASAPSPFNFVLAAAAAVAGAVQLAVIKKQEFARGGVAKQGTFGGRPHSSGGTKGFFEDGTQIEVEKDEDFIILNKRASAERRRLSNLNQRFGGVSFANGGIANVTSKLIPQFANGGFASDFVPQISLPSTSGAQAILVQSVAMFTDEQINVLAARVAQQTGAAAKSGVGEGLEDNNRLKERQEALTRNREA